MILATPTQMHAAQAIQCMRAGKHVQIEIPMADTLADAESVVRRAEGDRPDRDGRPHAPLQSQPPVDPQEDRGGRAEGPADGRADLFLPPHQHERAGQAAQLDRSPAVASRLPHGRSVPVSDRARRSSRCHALQGPIHPDARNRDGHEHRHEGAVAAPSARCRCRSTTTARWARSSATSATTAPTSAATTICSTARTTRSTSRRWTCR